MLFAQLHAACKMAGLQPTELLLSMKIGHCMAPCVSAADKSRSTLQLASAHVAFGLTRCKFTCSPTHRGDCVRSLIKPEERGRYQDIALAVAKVACLYSNASKEPSSSSDPPASPSTPPAVHSPRVVKPASPAASSPRSSTPGLSSYVSAKKAMKLLKASGAGGKDGVNRGVGKGEGLSPQVLLQVRMHCLVCPFWRKLSDRDGRRYSCVYMTLYTITSSRADGSDLRVECD